MKKIIIYIICLFLIINFSACKKNILQGSSVLKKFDIEEATKSVDAYMKANMKNDVEGMDKLYSNSFKKKTESKVPNNIIISGYDFDETTQSGDMGIISVKVTKLNTDGGYALLETDIFKVIKENKKYKIKNIDTKNEKEVFVSGKQLRLRIKDKAKTMLVTNFQGMPKYFYAQADKSKTNMIPVSLTQFGVVALTFGGTAQAISTKGQNAYIEVVHYEEEMMTQGGTSKGDSGSDSGTSDKSGDTENNIAPEKPLSKEIVPIDIISDCVIKNMVFSQDEKYLAVQYVKTNLGNSIKIYKNKTGEEASFEFDKNYPMQKVDVTINSFGKDVLIYTVTPRDNYKNDMSLKDITGKWQLDTKKFKPKLYETK